MIFSWNCLDFGVALLLGLAQGSLLNLITLFFFRFLTHRSLSLDHPLKTPTRATT